MKKKYNLFKSILVCFFVFVVLSWIIPVSTITEGALTTTTIKPVGIFGLIYYPIVTMTTFIQFAIIALVLGGFYGVLNKTGAYGKLVDKIVKNNKGKEKLFLILTITGFLVISSVLGIQYGILVFVPFVMAILLKMGFNKITSLSATIGAMLAGSIASTYGYNIGTQISQLLKTDINSNITFKIAFLVIVLFLYMLFITGNSESTLTKKIKKDELKKVPFLDDEITTKKQTKPLTMLFVVLGLLLFLGMTNWKYMFNIDIFEKFHESIATIKINDFSIFSAIINISNPIGYWSSNELVVILLIFSGLIGWIYGLKVDEIIEGFITGCKKMGKTSFLMTFGSIIFALMLVGGDSSMFVTIADKLAHITERFNFFFTSIIALLSGFFYNDFYYALNAANSTIKSISGDSFLLVSGFIFQTMHSIMMMIMPTSLILLAGLSILNISFKEWIKYIYKFIVQMIIISLVVSVILVLIA